MSLIESVQKEQLVAKCFECGAIAYCEWEPSEQASPFLALQALSQKQGWIGAKLSIICRSTGVLHEITVLVCGESCRSRLASPGNSQDRFTKFSKMYQEMWNREKDSVFPRIVSPELH